MTARAGRAAAALVLAVLLAGGAARAQGPPAMTDPGTRPAPPAGTAAVRGRVLDAETGLPLRRATVALRQVGDGRGGQSAMTDEDGAFAFEAVPTGRYRLSASKTRYVDTALGARAHGRPGRAFALAGGQKLEGVTIRLAAAGVITGRVFDDAGEPVANAHVSAMRQRTVNGATRLAPTMHGRTTDDTGAYRLFGLPPGRYVLSVRPGAAEAPTHDLVDTSGTALAPTYHPSTPVASEAQPVEVAAGLETFADVALVPTRVTSVTGEVVNVAGRPAKFGFVQLIPQGSGTPSDGGWLHGDVRDGAFTLSKVPPGDYTLSVQAFFGEDEMLRMMASGSIEVSAFKVPLTVSSTPVADLRVVVPPSIDVAGRVVFEGQPPAGSLPTATIFATASSAHGEMGPRTQIGADGRFTLRMLPGAWRFHALTARGWMPKRLSYRGRTLAPDAVVEVDTETGARIDILMTSQLTVVTGTASDAAGAPLLDYHAVVFPAEPAGGGPQSGIRTRAERADAQGRFRLEALLPGEYLVAAVADFEPGEQALDDELLDSLRAGATPIRLGEGETAMVTLKVSPVP
jgi:protocatechuate 3,4-dioxygenase beta subunit